MTRGSRHFTDQYTALETICRGCTKERGWIDADRRWGNPCKGLMHLCNDDDTSWFGIDSNGHMFCPKRKVRGFVKASVEREKYEKRMSGDWS